MYHPEHGLHATTIPRDPAVSEGSYIVEAWDIPIEQCSCPHAHHYSVRLSMRHSASGYDRVFTESLEYTGRIIDQHKVCALCAIAPSLYPLTGVAACHCSDNVTAAWREVNTAFHRRALTRGSLNRTHRRISHGLSLGVHVDNELDLP